MLNSDKEQRLATGEETLSLLCLGDDLLRCLLMLDCMGRQELSNLCLSCKFFMQVGAMVFDNNVWFAFNGTAVLCPGSNYPGRVDLRRVDPRFATVKRILNNAFCSSELISLDLPASLEYIGKNAFRCSMLRTLDLPASLKYIGKEAFYSSELTSLDLSA